MITLFCSFYNEAALIPFFLSHYHYVDAIQAFVTPSPDATHALLAADPRVTITAVDMPAGIDDAVKVDAINQALRTPDASTWHFVVDADEFIWPPGDPTGATAAAYLASVPRSDVALEGWLHQIYRHTEDADLDVTQAPVVLQRRHGYVFGWKPSVLRAHCGLQLVPGNHRLVGGEPCSPTHRFEGAHWQNADPSFAVTRRVRDRAARMSPSNLLHHHGTHHWGATAAAVTQELIDHQQDPCVF
jgi:hypothetical protein